MLGLQGRVTNPTELHGVSVPVTDILTPHLKFTSGPFKLMVIMSKSRLSWEEAVKLEVRGGYYNEGGVKAAKH